MNKCSYSGLTENSSFSPQASNQNFTLRGARRLPEYSELIQNWKITNENYTYVMALEDTDDPFFSWTLLMTLRTFSMVEREALCTRDSTTGNLPSTVNDLSFGGCVPTTSMRTSNNFSQILIRRSSS